MLPYKPEMFKALKTKPLTLIAIITIGVIIRFWNLDVKPLWLDEIATALFSLGNTYAVVEQQPILSVSTLDKMFAYKFTTCPQINQALMRQDNHPPLFFCLMHQWIGGLASLPQNLAWKMRSMSALFGSIAIVLVYFLNRIAFNHRSGLIAAAIMAVSPFGIYLSQEARQYSMSICLILLALIFLFKIQIILNNHQKFTLLRSTNWWFWILFNSLGFYVHYFFSFTFLAQILTLLILFIRQRVTITRSQWLLLGVSAATVILVYSLGISMVLLQSSGDRTDWLNFKGDYLSPFFRGLAGVITMIIMLPLEDQKLWMIILSASLMLLFSIYISWYIFQGLLQLLKQYKTTTISMLSFTGCTFLINLAIPYIFHKDITIAFRYNFTFFPGVCSLIGAALAILPQNLSGYARFPFKNIFKNTFFRNSESNFIPSLRNYKKLGFLNKYLPSSLFSSELYLLEILRINHASKILIIVGLLSSILVSINLTFVKPQYIEQVARKILSSTNSAPIVIHFTYNGVLNIAQGLSYGLEVYRISNKMAPIWISFVQGKTANDKFPLYINYIQKKFNNSFVLWLVGDSLIKDINSEVQVLTANKCRPKNGSAFQYSGLKFYLHRCDNT